MKKSWYDGGFPHKNNEPTVDNCINCRFSYGGDKGTRTPGLSIANAALYQLSYIPKANSILQQIRRDCKGFVAEVLRGSW